MEFPRLEKKGDGGEAVVIRRKEDFRPAPAVARTLFPLFDETVVEEFMDHPGYRHLADSGLFRDRLSAAGSEVADFLIDKGFFPVLDPDLGGFIYGRDIGQHGMNPRIKSSRAARRNRRQGKRGRRDAFSASRRDASGRFPHASPGSSSPPPPSSSPGRSREW